MTIDIDRLTEDELRELHHRVTERLRMISQLRAHGVMMRFSIGERVVFNAEGRRIAGVLTRYNRKSVTVIADGGHRWNVSPALLERISASAPGTAAQAPIVVMTEGRTALGPLARIG